MKRMILVKTGSYDAFEIEEVEVRTLQTDEIEIEVAYAGLAFADVMMRFGKYPGAPKLPFTPGYDISGQITAIGASVKNFKVGDRVAALPQFGGYTQLLRVKQERVFLLESSTDLKKAVCLMLNYTSAYQMLTRVAKVKEGQTILVHSAAGGVGTALLDLARYFKLNVYGTASSNKLEVLEKFGAIAIDYQENDFVETILSKESDKIDLVLDPIGQHNWIKSKQIIKKGGMLIGFGMLSMFAGNKLTGSFFSTFKTIATLKIFSGGKKFNFYGINFKKDVPSFRSDVNSVIRLYNEKKLEPQIFSVLPLAEIAKAHQLLSERKSTGKIILDCKKM